MYHRIVSRWDFIFWQHIGLDFFPICCFFLHLQKLVVLDRIFFEAFFRIPCHETKDDFIRFKLLLTHRDHSRSKQRTDHRVLVLTLKFLALKICFFHVFGVKNSKKDLCFQKHLKNFFDPKSMKKPPSKVAHNRPKPFFSQSSPAHSPQPRIYFSYTEGSCLMLLMGPGKIRINQTLH